MSEVEGAASDTESHIGKRPQQPSEMYQAYLRRLRLNRHLVLASQFFLLVVFLAVWEVAPRAQWVNPMLTSYPSAIWPVLTTGAAEIELYYHTGITALETIVGFSAAMVLGTLIAVILWWSDFLYRVLDPYLVVVNALPKVALLPIFFIFFGDVASIFAIAFAIAIFITILMIYSGFKEIDPNKIKLVRSFNASKRQILTKVVLPGSVPTMIATLKINVGLSLVGVIVGEFQAGYAGLGSLIIYGSQLFAMDMVMASIAILAVISTLMYMCVSYIESIVMRHRT